MKKNEKIPYYNTTSKLLNVNTILLTVLLFIFLNIDSALKTRILMVRPIPVLN